MTELRVGVRDLKAQLSEYLRQVKAGETVVITEHGRAIGRIIPEGEGAEARVRRLVESGALAWNGQRLSPSEPVADNEGDVLLSDIVSQLRE